MKARLPFWVVLLAASVGFAQKADPTPAANAKALEPIGKPAPDFTLHDLGGQSFRLSDHRGQITVLAFWATWCPPCRAEMPTFAHLQKELAADGVTVVPIANDTAENARGFLATKKIDVQSLIDDQANESVKVSRQYGANALPRTFVIDRSGVVCRVFIRKVSKSDLMDAIRAAQDLPPQPKSQ